MDTDSSSPWTQTSAAAQAWMSLWLQIAVQDTQNNMVPAAAWLLDSKMVSGGGPDAGYSHCPQWYHSLWTPTQDLYCLTWVSKWTDLLMCELTLAWCVWGACMPRHGDGDQRMTLCRLNSGPQSRGTTIFIHGAILLTHDVTWWLVWIDMAFSELQWGLEI